MENHPIDNLLKNTMESLRDMIDVNTIIGEPIESSDGTLILPVSRVSVGFAAGGGQYTTTNYKVESDYPFGGGSGAGMSVRPVAFLVIKDDRIRLLPMDSENTLDKIVDTVPQVLEMFKSKAKAANETSGQNTTNQNTCS
ncbi:MAG: GerW family sporulation protein [Clostridiaceae bacterium]